jgi:hypothetical protein
MAVGTTFEGSFLLISVEVPDLMGIRSALLVRWQLANDGPPYFKLGGPWSLL